jgi:predicted AlkP superfamily phosphohydrolase/phosphomutase
MSSRAVFSAVFLALVMTWAASGLAAGPKVLVLGFDGMDPKLLQEFMDEGLMPHFTRFLEQGAQFQPLGTTIPPQSPVAWSSFTSGTDPGGHGIFDFIHRDPRTMLPFLSTSSAQAPGAHFKVGKWKIPRGGGSIENLREGPAFWQALDDAGYDVTVFKVPANFPPVDCEARTLSGMGTPDILGTYGIFRYITDDPNVSTVVDGGSVDPVIVRNGQIETTIEGPINSYLVDEAQTEIPVTITVDKENRTAFFQVEDDEFLLQEGEWSDWVDLRFAMVPMLKDVAGICRFYLLETSPHFRLYVTPVQIHPVHPEMPISTPDDYSKELAEDVGLFFTQGLPEDSAALEAGVLSDAQYASQSDQILWERQAQFTHELERFARLDEGFLFFYFNSPDQSCHVFWRSFDEDSPTHAEADPHHRHRVRDLYVELDGTLGKVMDTLGPETHIMIVSDHGFAPYRRSLHVNSWLREHGYLKLRDGFEPGDVEFLSGIDWAETRAYSVGINGLYLNLRGREKWGIVQPGPEAQDLLAQLVQELEADVDPESGQHPIKYAYRSDIVYSGAYRDRGPDIILGYHSGWRGSNESALGEVPAQVYVDNMLKWSGDHCMAADVVPGVVLTNRPFTQPDPTLMDMGPTILGLFGLEAPPEMTGRNLYAK